MKNSAFDDFSEGVLGACYDAYDFKTCQRSDGTTYGTSGDCTQLGSKEVSKSSSKKKTSKKSSWDPSDLAGKMGIEISKVAGPATGNDPGVAVQRHIDKMKATEMWYVGAEKKMFAGKLSEENYVQTLVTARAQAAQSGAQAMRQANRLVASGKAGSHYSREIYEWVKGNVDSYDQNIKQAVSFGALKAAPRIESIPKPQKAASKPSRNSGGSRTSGGSKGSDSIENDPRYIAAEKKLYARIDAAGIGRTQKPETMTRQQRKVFYSALEDFKKEGIKIATGGISLQELSAVSRQSNKHSDGTWKTRDGRSWTDYDAMFRHINRSGTTMWQPGMNPGYN
jgi:hypothetical protein